MKAHKADREFETLICQACKEYAETIPCTEKVPEHEFSPGFKAKMSELVKRMGRKTEITRFVQRAAAVFVAIVMALGGWLAVDGETRADFVSWLREGYENSVLYSFRNKTAVSELPNVELGWLPEGYELVMEEKDDILGYRIYENEQGNSISFCYHLLHSGSKISLEFGETEYEHRGLDINGMSAELYISTDPNESSGLIWFDEERGIGFLLSAFENESVILHIAEQVKLSE